MLPDRRPIYTPRRIAFAAFVAALCAGGYSFARLTPAERAEIAQIVTEETLRVGEDPLMVHAVVQQESNYNPRAIGPRTPWGRACGLGQFLVGTARTFVPGITCQQLQNPRVNARLTALYIRQARQRCGNDVGCIARHHHGGPNLRMHGRRTHAYGHQVTARVARMGGGRIFLASARIGTGCVTPDERYPSTWGRC